MANNLVVVYSYHHNNTEKIANAMAEILEAEVKHPQDISSKDIEMYDLIGFGAGIDSGKHYKEILEFAETLQNVTGKKAFIFSTCGVCSEKKKLKDHRALRNILEEKGYEIADEFACVGFDTNSILKYIGGIQKGRPNAEDLESAKEFARKLTMAG